MIESEKLAFKTLLNSVAAMYYKPEFSREVLQMWWGKLNQYDFNVVANAFDKFSDTSVKPPEPSDIIALCRHKVTIHQRLASPIAKIDNKRQSEEFSKKANELFNKKRDMKQWAKDLVSGKAVSNSANALKCAKEALNRVEHEVD